MREYINLQPYKCLITVVACCICVFLCQGCGTLCAITTDPTYLPRNRSKFVYSGVQCDVDFIKDRDPEVHVPGLLKIFPIIDLPFSFVLDTVLLPLTFPAEMLNALDNMFQLNKHRDMKEPNNKIRISSDPQRGTSVVVGTNPWFKKPGKFWR